MIALLGGSILATISIIPSISILLGLTILMFIIFDSYLKMKEPASGKQYGIHEQRDFVDFSGLPGMMNLPSLGLPIEPSPNQLGLVNNSQDMPAPVNQYGETIVAMSQVQPISPTTQTSMTNLPIPDSGLPEGWTIEQWNFYGAQWLESMNE